MYSICLIYSLSFWDHEWSKHGTCSGLSQYDYFNDSINLIKQVGTPSMVTKAVGSTINADDLRDQFGGSTKTSLLCENGSYLVGLYTCWTRDNSGNPSSQTTCPSDVQSEDTCRTNTLTVDAF